MRLEAQRALLADRATEALDAYREMLDCWPDDRVFLQEYTSFLQYWWYGEEGVPVAKRALTLYPDDPLLGNEYVIFLWFVGRMSEALEAARANALHHPDMPALWYSLGEAFRKVGLPDSAEAVYRRALEIDPKMTDSREGLALCAYSRGELTLAIELYDDLVHSDLILGERVRLLVPYNQTLGLAGVCAEAGQYKKALAVLEKGRSYISNDPRRKALFDNGYNRLLLRMGQNDEVLSWVRGLGHVTGYRRQASWYSATAFVGLDSLEEARSALADLELMNREGYRKARFMIPHVRAQIALVEGSPYEALAVLPDMGRYGAAYEGWFFILWKETTARANRMAGRFEEAAATHRELLSIYGGHALSHYELGAIYEEMKRPADAKKEYAKFLEMWSEADEGLPQLVDARKRLAAL
jgi:tetratricopeptide (TPR) repeat protein